MLSYYTTIQKGLVAKKGSRGFLREVKKGGWSLLAANYLPPLLLVLLCFLSSLPDSFFFPSGLFFGLFEEKAGRRKLILIPSVLYHVEIILSVVDRSLFHLLHKNILI